MYGTVKGLITIGIEADRGVIDLKSFPSSSGAEYEL